MPECIQMNKKSQDEITRRLICPICHTHLLPSLGYGIGYWFCNCALGGSIQYDTGKQKWVKQVESILGRA